MSGTGRRCCNAPVWNRFHFDPASAADDPAADPMSPAPAALQIPADAAIARPDFLYTITISGAN